MGAEYVHGRENNIVFELASPHDVLSFEGNPLIIQSIKNSVE